jgi:NADH dehydrogenase (ubiquinone) 1 alpha subcomplex subunit 9
MSLRAAERLFWSYCAGQVVSWKDFNLRDDAAIRETIKRSNVVVNLIGAERETWNFSFEDVHVDAARRIAQAAAENPLTERFVHLSCIGASENASSRRLRTKVGRSAPEPGACLTTALPHKACSMPDVMPGEKFLAPAYYWRIASSRHATRC